MHVSRHALDMDDIARRTPGGLNACDAGHRPDRAGRNPTPLGDGRGAQTHQAEQGALPEMGVAANLMAQMSRAFGSEPQGPQLKTAQGQTMF